MRRTISSDFVGRIRNISLAPSPANALVPLYETITNSIQAIEDRFGKDNIASGYIEVRVIRNEKDGIIEGFEVSDNGIGMTPDNLESFSRSDSRLKIERGGKGVGRLLWLKVFDAAHVESKYGLGQDESLSFDFILEEEDQLRNITPSGARNAIGTTVKLYPFKASFKSVCPRKESTIQAKIISHFLAYFVNMTAPKIVVIDDGTADLFSIFTEFVKDDFIRDFDVTYNEEEIKFRFNGFLLPKHLSDDEKGNNAIFYGANGRSVTRVAIDNRIGLTTIDGAYAFYAFISSSYLDMHVNQERTEFSWPDDLRREVHRKAVGFSLEFLSKFIEEIREKQAAKVSKLVNEHLRFLTVVENPQEFAETLQLSTQTEEDIYIELSRDSLRKEKRVRSEYANAKKKKSDIDEDVKKYAAEIKKESLASLAEYVYKRKLILNILEDNISFSDIETRKYQLEDVVHDLICPLRVTKSELGYNDHNLWIVDDQLAFYSYFNSDKTLKATTGDASSSTAEPDITFFDLGIGLDRAGTLDPVSIVEFKRPGRDDYTLASNPIVQIRDYATKLRDSKRIVSYKGLELRAIDDKTPFNGHIIADITPSLERMMKMFGPFTQRAGHRCYYKWDDDYHMFIQIQSYADVLRGAKARNEAFFNKLGLSN